MTSSYPEYVCVCLSRLVRMDWSDVFIITGELVNHTIVLSLKPLLCGRRQLLILAHTRAINWPLNLPCSCLF